MHPAQTLISKTLQPKPLKTLCGAGATGSALVVVDTAGRVLELALLLERHWERSGLPYPLALLAPMARNVLAFAGAQLEWMADGLPRALEHSRANPFALRRARASVSKSITSIPPPAAAAAAPTQIHALSRADKVAAEASL